MTNTMALYIRWNYRDNNRSISNNYISDSFNQCISCANSTCNDKRSCLLAHYTEWNDTLIQQTTALYSMQLAIWPTLPALMLVSYRFTRLFVDGFYAIGAPSPPPTPPLLVIKRFLPFANWLMGLKSAFLLRVQSRIWAAFGSWFWGELYLLTGAH